jgi:hypothetical protein
MAREQRAVWVKRVARWESSGLSLRAFARDIGVNGNTLAGWRWRLKSEQQGRSMASSPAAPECIPLVEVKAAVIDDARYEVTLAGGRTVRVPNDFNPKSLRALLDVLEGR